MRAGVSVCVTDKCGPSGGDMNEEDGNEEAHLIDFRTRLWWTATDPVAGEPIGTERRGGGGGASGCRGQVQTCRGRFDLDSPFYI